MSNVIQIDFHSNIVFTDDGQIHPVENYFDEYEEPCVIEESVGLYYIKCGMYIERYDFTEEDLDRVIDAFDQN